MPESGTEIKERSPAKPRRLLFNCDGNSARIYENEALDARQVDREPVRRNRYRTRRFISVV